MEDQRIHIEVVIERIEGLKEVLETRFTSIDKRLDKINGKVGNHEEFISRTKGYLAVLGIIGTGALGLIIDRINDFFRN